MIILHSLFLVQRTILSVVVARLDGRIVRDLISANKKGFARGIGLWFLLALPSTCEWSVSSHRSAQLTGFSHVRHKCHEYGLRDICGSPLNRD